MQQLVLASVSLGSEWVEESTPYLPFPTPSGNAQVYLGEQEKQFFNVFRFFLIFLRKLEFTLI